MEAEHSKIDQLIALTQNLEAITEAIRESGDKLIKLGVIGDFHVMSGTLGKLNHSIENIGQVKATITESIENNSTIKYKPNF